MAVVVMAGAPGSGKTTLARMLASDDPHGVHIETDLFFRFIANRIDPSLPEARQQNEAAVRAYVAAAREYAEAGYSIYLDGVIGPWLLPLIGEKLGSFHYVLLKAPLDVLLARASVRSSQPSATADVVRRMHEQFETLPNAFAAHVIETGGQSAAQVLDAYRLRSARGDFICTATQ